MKRTLLRLNLVLLSAVLCGQFGNTCGAQDPVTPPTAEKIVPQGNTKPQVEIIQGVVDGAPLAVNRNPDVFYNYYLQPSYNGTAASMYPAPHPIPARVGHSHYTYPPLLPHEYMYRHRRVYYTPHAPREMFYTDPCKCKQRGQSYTRTSVIYTHGFNFLAPLPLQLPSFSLPIRKACGATCR